MQTKNMFILIYLRAEPVQYNLELLLILCAFTYWDLKVIET